MVAAGGEVGEFLCRGIELCGVKGAAHPSVDDVRRLARLWIRKRVEARGGDTTYAGESFC